MKYTVYILKSKRDNSYYIGNTNNLEKRLIRHNKGYNKSTKRKTPWEIVYIEYYDNRQKAIKRELEIKKIKSRKYIEKLIFGGR